jgi:hypothetical protein
MATDWTARARKLAWDYCEEEHGYDAVTFESKPYCGKCDSVSRSVAALVAEAFAAGFQEWGPLFHRDLCRVLGIPESTSLDETMAEILKIQERAEHYDKGYDAGHAAGVREAMTRTAPLCVCGHEFYAHFDHTPVGCKSCGCIAAALRAREG